MAATMKLIVVLIIVLVASAISEGDNGSTTSTTSKTTTKSTSTTTTTATTTPASSTTTVTTTTTTAKPTTHPAPLDYWVVTDDQTGIKCILMKAKIDITYNNVSMMVPQPNNGSTANGTCGNDSQTIEIEFQGGLLTLDFSAIAKSERHSLTALSFNGTSLNISSTKFWANDKGLLSNKAYKCDANTVLYENGKNKVVVSDMMLEVFRTSNSTAFSSNTESCTSDNKVSNLVPIIVGACLGGLILIVLIAYLIGRKRSRHGYEQV